MDVLNPIPTLYRYKWLLILSLLCSCALPSNLRQKAKAERVLDRALRLDPTLAVTTTETIYDTIRIDTVIVRPGGSADSTFTLALVDSILLEDAVSRATVSLRRDLNRFSMRLTIPPDTVHVTDTLVREIQVSTVTIKARSFYRWLRSGYRWITILAAVLLFILGWKFINDYL